MARVTLVFAVLLVALGAIGYVGTGSEHPTALIPGWFGLGLGLCGFLALKPGLRALFMHIGVTIATLGFLGAAAESIRGYAYATSSGGTPDQIALAAKLVMAGLLLIYVILCVRSFIAARRSRVG